MNYITTALRHCLDRGKIAANPLKGIQKPRWQRRKMVMASTDLEAVYHASWVVRQSPLTLGQNLGKSWKAPLFFRLKSAGLKRAPRCMATT